MRRGLTNGSGSHGPALVPTFTATSTLASTTDAYFGFTPHVLDLSHWWDIDEYADTTLPDQVGDADLSNDAAHAPTTSTRNSHTVLHFDGTKALVASTKIPKTMHVGTTHSAVAFYKREDDDHSNMAVLGDALASTGFHVFLRDSQGNGERQLRFQAYGSGEVVCRVPHIDNHLADAPHEAWIFKPQPDEYDQADFDDGGPGCPVRAAGSRSLARSEHYDADGWYVYNDKHDGPNDDTDSDAYFCLGGPGAASTTGTPGTYAGNGLYHGVLGDVIALASDPTDLEALALLAWYYKRYALDAWLGEGVFA